MTDQNWAQAQSLFSAQALSKAEVRQLFKKWSPTQLSSEKLNLVLQQFLKMQNGIWASFMAMANEVSIETSHQVNNHIQWAFPRVSSRGNGDQLQFYIPGAGGFEVGAFGLLEPRVAGAKEVSLAELTGVLIPGVAYDLEGTRLGRGKGFYDKSLNGFTKQKVGIAAHEQVFQKLPREEHDLRVQHLVTDCGILHF